MASRLMTCWVSLATCLFCLQGCGPKETKDKVARDPAPSSIDARQQVRHRAEQLWTARQAKAWSALYDYETPARRAELSQDDFAAWIEDTYPFNINSFTLGNLAVEGDIAWVQLEYEATLVKFPQAPARETTIVELWQRVKKQWYPVPAKERENFPSPPWLRDRDAESRLRVRFLMSWQYRQFGKTDALYAMIDPEDLSTLSFEDFQKGEQLTRYVAMEFHWAEVIGQQGRVNATITHKVTDPSLTKLPAKVTRLTESWINREGEWYRDYNLQPKDADPQGR